MQLRKLVHCSTCTVHGGCNGRGDKMKQNSYSCVLSKAERGSQGGGRGARLKTNASLCTRWVKTGKQHRQELFTTRASLAFCNILRMQGVTFLHRGAQASIMARQLKFSLWAPKESIRKGVPWSCCIGLRRKWRVSEAVICTKQQQISQARSQANFITKLERAQRAQFIRICTASEARTRLPC